MKQLIGVLSFIFIAVNAYTQVVADAARFSQTQLGGTARYIGVGGSLGALGGDFSVLSTNPAGLALFRRSEFVLTPSFSFINSDASLRVDDISTSDNSNGFGLNNLGVVFVRKPRAGSKWKTFNVGLGYNRISNYRERFSYEGISQGSITDRWVDDANFITDETPNGIISDFGNGLGIDVEALFFDGCGDDYVTDFTSPTDCNTILPFSLTRDGTVERSGAINEMTLSFAGNYDEKFMFGLTLGVPFLSFEQSTTYRELNEPLDTNLVLNALRFDEQLNTSGIGINAKLGIIYRANQALRLGAAIHTPSFYSLTDNFGAQLVYDFTLQGVTAANDAESPDGVFDYGFRTPWRYFANAGLIIAKSGFISAEVEFVDYGNSKFNITKSDPSFQGEEDLLNEDVSIFLNNAVNFKIGGEYALERLRFRAGINFIAPTFAEDTEYDNTLTLGIGYRPDNFYIDFAYARTNLRGAYAPYTLSNGIAPQLTDVDIVRNNLFLTVGFKF